MGRSVVPKAAKIGDRREDVKRLPLTYRSPAGPAGFELPAAGERLLELERLGEVGAAAEQHYSIMGYILKPETLLHETTPAIIHDLRAEQADIVDPGSGLTDLLLVRRTGSTRNRSRRPVNHLPDAGSGHC